MRWAAALLVLLLAGCSSPDAAAPARDGEDASRQSAAGSLKAQAQGRVRVFDHTIEWQPDAGPAPTAMDVPANASDLVLTIENTPTASCGQNWGDLDQPVSPQVTFTTPSGASTTVDLWAQECDAVVVSVTTINGDSGLPAEPGAWQVTFDGRGVGLRQHLMVDATVP